MQGSNPTPPTKRKHTKMQVCPISQASLFPSLRGVSINKISPLGEIRERAKGGSGQAPVGQDREGHQGSVP